MSRRDKNAEVRPLKDAQRKFIHNIVYSGMDKIEAYADAYDVILTEENRQRVEYRAVQAFYYPHVNRYYHSLMEEIRDNEVKKGVWTKELATDKLMKLINRAEEEIYGGGKITMSRLNAILLPVKELNTMNGFNETNIRVEGTMVQFIGEENLPE